jgi:hypothetical protein
VFARKREKLKLFGILCLDEKDARVGDACEIPDGVRSRKAIFKINDCAPGLSIDFIGFA